MSNPMKDLSGALGIFAGIIPGLFGGGGKEEAPPQTIINPPAPIAAASSPVGNKPGRRSAQPSFLSSTAAPPVSASGQTGKSLLGQ